MSPDLFTFAAAQTTTTAMLSSAMLASRQMTSPRRTRGKRIAFNVYEGENVRTITPAGRDAWALGELIVSGADGCTPLDNPGPRWSGYVFKLKRVYGLDIETITEGHAGEFAGHHARYVLRSRVQFADPADASNAGGGHE
jgi:hypothetical protein